MTLILLKADGHFTAWIDGASVRVGMSIEELFGRLSGKLEATVRDGETIVARCEEEWGGKPYLSFAAGETAQVRAQLACFGARLDEAAVFGKAPR